ncbi:GTP pyrophosphokinase [Vibrio diabolicus]|uniref:GTP pyrophosphokinase n=1 Tax=Vibrio diabolicus TaxID=50719 RepID=UPI00375302D7
MYKAWGDLVVSDLCQRLVSVGRELDVHLKQPAKARVKSDDSLIDKAFYRPNKNYENPYEDIEDKVGCRFVVLLVEHINELSDIIKSSDRWEYKECRHFNEERKKDPLLFTYQSVHYVVRAKTDEQANGLTVKAGTPCEIQVRTLLQHAYAELTHDAVYKAKTVVEPEVHRTVAKSMTLIETTDDFFSDVNNKLNRSASDELSFQQELDTLYTELIGIAPRPAQKSSIVVLDEFDNLVNEDLIVTIQKLAERRTFIIDSIKAGVNNFPFYSQSVSIFTFWLALKRRNRLLEDWPLERKILERVASDAGVSIER